MAKTDPRSKGAQVLAQRERAASEERMPRYSAAQPQRVIAAVGAARVAATLLPPEGLLSCATFTAFHRTSQKHML